ncbi:hypothetical protein BDW69DRAFT_65049 [Aspergillus filifer]
MVSTNICFQTIKSLISYRQKRHHRKFQLLESVMLGSVLEALEIFAKLSSDKGRRSKGQLKGERWTEAWFWTVKETSRGECCSCFLLCLECWRALHSSFTFTTSSSSTLCTNQAKKAAMALCQLGEYFFSLGVSILSILIDCSRYLSISGPFAIKRHHCVDNWVRLCI